MLPTSFKQEENIFSIIVSTWFRLNIGVIGPMKSWKNSDIEALLLHILHG